MKLATHTLRLGKMMTQGKKSDKKGAAYSTAPLCCSPDSVCCLEFNRSITFTECSRQAGYNSTARPQDRAERDQRRHDCSHQPRVPLEGRQPDCTTRRWRRAISCHCFRRLLHSPQVFRRAAERLSRPPTEIFADRNLLVRYCLFATRVFRPRRHRDRCIFHSDPSEARLAFANPTANLRDSSKTLENLRKRQQQP